MRNRRQLSANRFAKGQSVRMVLAMAITAGCLGSIGGCEKLDTPGRAADRKVDEAMAQSDTDRSSGGEQGAAKALKDLQQAASTASASDAGKARAKSELAREQYRQALALLGEIHRNEEGINQAAWDLREAAFQIGARVRVAKDELSAQPGPAAGKMDENIKAGEAAIAQAKGEADKLKADLADRQKKIDGLKAERQKAEADAEQLTDKATGAKGKAALDLIQQAADARTKAGTLAAQVEMHSAALMPIQRQIAILDQEQQLWQAGNKESTDAQAVITGGLAKSKETGEKLVASAKAVLDDAVTPKGDKDTANAGKRLADLWAENDRVRGEATKLLQDSAKNAGEAAQAAKSFKVAIQQRISDLQGKGSGQSPEIPPLKALIAAYEDGQYQLQKGNTELALADLAADQAREAAAVKLATDELTASLQGVNLPVPTSLPQPKVDALKKAAIDDFQAAEATLEGLSNTTTNSPDATMLKNAALSSLMLAQYGHFQLTLDDTTRQALGASKQRAQENQLEIPASVRNVQ